MTHELFKGWTDKQLMAAFALASAEQAARKKNKEKEAFWRNVAYLAKLTTKPEPR